MRGGQAALLGAALLLCASPGGGSSSLALRGGGNAPSRARQGKGLRKLVAIGGTTNGDQPLRSVESLPWHQPLLPKKRGEAQSIVREWQQEKEALLDARDSPAAVVAFGRAYVLGGYNGTKELSSVEWSDCPVQTAKRGPSAWAEAPGMKKRRCSPGASVLGKMIFAVGGYNGTHDLRNTEFLEVGEQGKWAEGGPGWAWGPTMNYRRSGLSVVSLKGKLFGFGGFDGVNLLSSVEEMDGDRWTRFPSMPMGRRGGTAAVALRGRIFVIGGANEQDRLTRVESVDPREGRWTVEPGMNVPRAGLGATVLEEKLQMCVAGGYDGATALKSAEIYDLRMRGSWLFEPDMVAQRWGMALIAV